MALVNSSFTVNITPGAMPPTVHVSEYDVGRTYTVTINGENGSVFNIPTGTTATVEGTLNGVIGFNTDATISGSTVSFTLTESMTAKSGKAWCKIKLTLNNEPIQTCAFVLAVDRAGVEADTVIGADGFDTQIVNAVNDWLDEHPPASGGMTEAFKQALLDCFENVAWINDDGQTYYDALYAALYPPKTLVSISAVFTQGSAVIYDTDSLDTLKQYLTVTAIYDDTSTGVVTNYTLSGTLTVGTSTITVLYNGKTTTFNVAVTGNEGLMLNDILTLDGIKNTRSGHNASASTWEDLSGNNNDFTKLGTRNLVWQSNCAVFDGTSESNGDKQTLSINKNLLNGLSVMTVEVVGKFNGNGGLSSNSHYYGGLFTQYTWDTAAKYLRIATLDTTTIMGNFYGASLAPGPQVSGIWYIAYVFDGSNCTIYVNGEVFGTRQCSFPTTKPSSDFYIGSANNTAAYNGNLYRLGISGSIMTPEQIAERYNFFASRFA